MYKLSTDWSLHFSYKTPATSPPNGWGQDPAAELKLHLPSRRGLSEDAGHGALIDQGVVMSSFRKLTLAAAISSTVALAGCSSSDGGGSSSETVSGTATAPGGQVAHFETRNLFEIAAEFFISPAAAAVLGLDPMLVRY